MPNMMIKMEKVPEGEWAHLNSHDSSNPVISVFKSDKFLVQIRRQRTSIRLSINKIAHTFEKGKPIWKDGITWDELQEIKNQCGFEKDWFSEYYPPRDEVVNIANIRHLWIMDKRPEETL